MASVLGPRAAASSRGGGGAAAGGGDSASAAAVSVEWRGPGGVGTAAATAAAAAAAAPSSSPVPTLSAAAAASFIRSCVQSALEQRELPPRSAVAVVVHILSADGAELAAATNAVSAALSDAAMPLRFSFAAATVSVAAAAAVGAAAGGEDGEGKGKGKGDCLLLLDPTSLEEASPASFATATAAFACAAREPGGPPVVDSGSVLALRCCSRAATGGAGAGGGGGGESRSPEASGFGTDPECSLLALAVDAAAKGAQRVAEFGRMSLEASLGGGGGGGGGGGLA